MIRLRRIIAPLALLALASFGFAIPKALIIQGAAGAQTENGPVLLGDALAQALEEDGKLDPVVWSDADPVFRAALLDGRVKGSATNPTAEDVQAAAKALGCDYVIRVDVVLKGTSVSGHIDLMKGPQSVWTDTEAMDPHRSSSGDLDNAVRSVARTWVVHMSAGPLKKFVSEPHPPSAPPPAQGQAPTVGATADPVHPQPDSSKALAEAQTLIAGKKLSEATITLREAIDASPLDAKLRIALIDVLRQMGRKSEAADEATRASLLIPDSSELRALAAQSFIDTGQSAQAEAQLNEALARNPDDVATRTMIADMDLSALKAQAALEHIDAALKKAPSRDLTFRRATADALLGDGPGVSNDLNQANQLTNWTGSEDETYTRCMRALDNGLDQEIGDLRSLVQRATVKRTDPDVAKEIDDQTAVLKARQALLSGWTPPSAHKTSHGKRVLALNLLSEFLSGLKSFLSDGSEDTLGDANINLGEAVKQLVSARGALATEQGSIAKVWKHSPISSS